MRRAARTDANQDEIVGVEGKGRPRMTRQGHAFTPAKTRNREAHIKLCAQQAMGDRPLIEGPVRLSILATFDVPASWSKRKRSDALSCLTRPTKVPDCDNIAKLADALNGVVWADDKQVVELRVSKIYGSAPSTSFRVEEITP